MTCQKFSSKTLVTVATLVAIFVSFTSVGTASTPQRKTIGSLPNGVTVGAFSIAVYNFYRVTDGVVFEVVERKLRNTANYIQPMNFAVFDNHGNKHDIFGGPDPFLEPTLDLYACPVGFTWKFKVQASVPETIPLNAFERFEIATKTSTGRFIEKEIYFSINLKNKVFPAFQIENLLNLPSDAQIIIVGNEYREDEKYLTVLVKSSIEENITEGYYYGDNFVYRHHEFNLQIKNTDYVDREFQVFVYYQWGDGTISNSIVSDSKINFRITQQGQKQWDGGSYSPSWLDKLTILSSGSLTWFCYGLLDYFHFEPTDSPGSGGFTKKRIIQPRLLRVLVHVVSYKPNEYHRPPGEFYVWENQ